MNTEQLRADAAKLRDAAEEHEALARRLRARAGELVLRAYDYENEQRSANNA